jgi:multiple RNA-binding domain-containing protein 1
MSSSRLIVKNIPKYLTEDKLREHFQKKGGKVTDAKIIYRGSESRKFAYVGFRTEEDASVALKYFNNTFIDTAKI